MSCSCVKKYRQYSIVVVVVGSGGMVGVSDAGIVVMMVVEVLYR